MSAQTVPVPVTISPWAPSLPNSDAWILTSTIDDAGLKQVAALPGLSFGSQTAMSVATAPYNAPPSAVSISTAHSVPATQPRRSLAPIGRGHPSSSKRSTSSVQPAAIDAATAPTPIVPAVAAAASSQTPQPRARINSSTIKPRTERFPARTLYTIAEEPSVRFITTNTPASPRCAEEHSTPAPAPWSKESNHDSSVMTIRFQTVNGVAQSVTSWVDEVEEEIFEHDGCAQKLYRSWADEVDAEMERDAVQTGSNELVWKEGVAVKFSMRVGFGPVFLF
ncbi:hypothetical protein DFH06DRAFT_1485060 [Mycena polygramma]|nr:hypothetical protein DFH06DRAFT_1485060 [Mycena polygramma]